jgi:hypothetical protein
MSHTNRQLELYFYEESAEELDYGYLQDPTTISY